MKRSGAYTLITGASSGMGEATAKLLSSSRNLILHGRDEERLAAVGEFCSHNGADVALFPFDLEHADTVGSALTSFLKERETPVEAFVHFAGMTEVLPIAKTKYSVGLRVMNVNYFSATEIISALLKKKVNGDALRSIVLTSSIVVPGGKRYQPHYCSSKGAVTSLAMALACELAPRVRVNVIAPGSFGRVSPRLFLPILRRMLPGILPRFCLPVQWMTWRALCVFFFRRTHPILPVRFLMWMAENIFPIFNGGHMNKVLFHSSMGDVSSRHIKSALQAVAADECDVLYIHTDMTFGLPVHKRRRSSGRTSGSH